jgi:pyruvate,water dikinase
MPRLRVIYGWVGALDVNDPSTDRVAAWRRLWAYVEEAWYWHFLVLYPCFAAARHLTATCCELLGDEAATDALRLTAGHVDTMHRVEVDLWSLVEAAQRVPDVVDAIGRRSADLAELDPGIELGEELDRFIAAHGHLGADSDDLAATTWSDEPWRVLREIQRMIRSRTSPEDRRVALLNAGDALFDALRERVAGRSDRERFDDAVALARAVFPLAEDHNYWLDRMLHASVRGALLRVGEHLVGEGVVGRPDEIWYLHVDEVAALMAAPRNCRDLVRRRRAERRAWSRSMPRDRPSADAAEAGRHGPEDTTVWLRGIGASPGLAVGRARVVRTTPEAAAAPAGCVLVCPNTNASWVTLIADSVALVTSTGSEVSHGAIVAREFALPAVVGVRGALDTICDGMLVEVDGDAGTVRVLGAEAFGEQAVVPRPSPR